MTTAGVRVRTRNTSNNPYFLSPTPSLYLSRPHHNSVSDVKELEDGTIATCSWDGTLKIWSRRGTCLFSFSHTTQIMCFVELKNNHNGGDNSSRCNIAFGDDNGLVHVLNYRVNNSYNFNQNGSDIKFRDDDPFENSDSGRKIAVDEARKLLRLADVEALKKRLESDGHEFITYPDLLKLCQGTGVAHSDEEAAEFAKILDEAGVVLIFRNKVILHPHKVAELVRNAVPLALTAEDDPRRQELERLQKEKEEIDRIAHKHVRRVLWSGLGSLSVVTILFFRLTFWEFSWDVMEPIAFFGTTGGLIVGYLYFLVTSRDPTYQDFMKRLFLRRQRKLCKKRKFDVDRFLELQKQCQSSLDSKRDLEALVGD